MCARIAEIRIELSRRDLVPCELIPLKKVRSLLEIEQRQFDLALEGYSGYTFNFKDQILEIGVPYGMQIGDALESPQYPTITHRYSKIYANPLFHFERLFRKSLADVVMEVIDYYDEDYLDEDESYSLYIPQLQETLEWWRDDYKKRVEASLIGKPALEHAFRVFQEKFRLSQKIKSRLGSILFGPDNFAALKSGDSINHHRAPFFDPE